MKNNYFLILLTSLAIVSCKTSPLVMYEEISNRNNSTTINSIDLRTNTSIPLNTESKFKLKLKDSILIYGIEDTLYSNYQKIKFNAESNKEYEISVFSFCDCFGFDKYMFVPKIKVFNSKGDELNTNLIINEVDYLYIAKPISYNKRWIINDNIEGEIIIVVYSDNSKLKKKVHNLIIPLVGIPYKIQSTLVGKFIITVGEKNETVRPDKWYLGNAN